MTFFDRNDLITQFKQWSNLDQMKQDKAYYLREIEKNREMIEGLTTDTEQLETFAREKYLMKKDNEDVFVIVKKTD
jgi:cell division protein FtsB